ncbi:MAG: D-2-hydroxyacid dehydrogenase [Candidatus Nephthysia bennettiae]|uniref:D-2-hydroxyacid dehydrogenase n=1 Tax=Candidatus Nephthysia bennettiae TaxID=3127016 RepID=A0A934K6A7_9BACT|nr:D-2-hydroxyacid dehydrogenase [Candidatus Dormibacteraeota bacterium]PZR91946.1 MAG: D-2-hydroxyacid dehydrogenase [Candidatus Dormibacteraeota bacterium]
MSSPVRVAVAGQHVDGVRRRLGDLGDAVHLLPLTAGSAASDVRAADAALAWDIGDAELHMLLDHAPGLRWLHSPSAGVDKLPLAELRRHNIALTNAAGVFAVPISEWVMGTLLAIAKKTRALYDAQRDDRWHGDLALEELTGKTLLLLGSGGIGREIARRAAPFGMRIWASGRTGRAVEGTERVVSGDGWRTLLPDADFVVMSLPLTDSTRGTIGSQELRSFKQGAWLVNVGRGATTEEQAVLEAVREGRLGGAAIDAWTEEPLPPDHPAWTMANVIVSPHVSGSSPLNNERTLTLFVDNLRRFVNGEDLRNRVDLALGY